MRGLSGGGCGVGGGDDVKVGIVEDGGFEGGSVGLDEVEVEAGAVD